MTGASERVIGVLGGMGPEATLAFYGWMIAQTRATRDQDHLRVIIDSNPKVPDRTAAVLGEGPSPVPMMVSGIEALRRAGADFAVIPCVSAHAFMDELKERSSLPITSILDEMAEQIRGDGRKIGRIGLLATTGTLRVGLFQRRLREAGIDVLIPDESQQARVQSAIYAVKGDGSRPAAARDLREVADQLVRAGAQAIVLGCTEIPLVFDAEGLRVPVFDSLLILARAAVREAGRKLGPLEPGGGGPC